MPGKGGEGRCALTFGYDRSLISSRQRLLEKTGCRSIVAPSLPEFQEALQNNAVDLVVLCQTINPEECRLAAQMVNERAPHAGVLIMYNRHDYCKPAGDCVLLDSMAGPGVFVQTAERMLVESAWRVEPLPATRLSSAAPR